MKKGFISSMLAILILFWTVGTTSYSQEKTGKSQVKTEKMEKNAAVSLKNKLHWDDALDVWGVHGVGGALGIVMLGLLGTTAINPGGANGLFYGGADFFFKELVAIVVSSVYAFVFTYAMLWIINKITTVKTSEVEESTLDESLHGESAYV